MLQSLRPTLWNGSGGKSACCSGARSDAPLQLTLCRASGASSVLEIAKRAGFQTARKTRAAVRSSESDGLKGVVILGRPMKQMLRIGTGVKRDGSSKLIGSANFIAANAIG